MHKSPTAPNAFPYISSHSDRELALMLYSSWTFSRLLFFVRSYLLSFVRSFFAFALCCALDSVLLLLLFVLLVLLSLPLLLIVVVVVFFVGVILMEVWIPCLFVCLLLAFIFIVVRLLFFGAMLIKMNEIHFGLTHHTLLSAVSARWFLLNSNTLSASSSTSGRGPSYGKLKFGRNQNPFYTLPFHTKAYIFDCFCLCLFCVCFCPETMYCPHFRLMLATSTTNQDSNNRQSYAMHSTHYLLSFSRSLALCHTKSKQEMQNITKFSCRNVNDNDRYLHRNFILILFSLLRQPTLQSENKSSLYH